jgi:hypothetical protein
MSTLVELPSAECSRAAFDQFHPEEVNFAIGNARAMIWFSQLAYETGKPQTIELVRNQFGFTSVLPFVKRNTDFRYLRYHRRAARRGRSCVRGD